MPIHLPFTGPPAAMYPLRVLARSCLLPSFAKSPTGNSGEIHWWISFGGPKVRVRSLGGAAVEAHVTIPAEMVETLEAEQIAAWLRREFSQHLPPGWSPEIEGVEAPLPLRIFVLEQRNRRSLTELSDCLINAFAPIEEASIRSLSSNEILCWETPVARFELNRLSLRLGTFSVSLPSNIEDMAPNEKTSALIEAVSKVSEMATKTNWITQDLLSQLDGPLQWESPTISDPLNNRGLKIEATARSDGHWARVVPQGPWAKTTEWVSIAATFADLDFLTFTVQNNWAVFGENVVTVTIDPRSKPQKIRHLISADQVESSVPAGVWLPASGLTQKLKGPEWHPATGLAPFDLDVGAEVADSFASLMETSEATAHLTGEVELDETDPDIVLPAVIVLLRAGRPIPMTWASLACQELAEPDPSREWPTKTSRLHSSLKRKLEES